MNDQMLVDQANNLQSAKATNNDNTNSDLVNTNLNNNSKNAKGNTKKSG
jgi:hypothetical protein